MEHDTVKKTIEIIIILLIIKQNLITKQRKKIQEDRESVIEIFQKMKKSKKEIMLTTETKICQMWIEKKEKKYEKSLTFLSSRNIKQCKVCKVWESSTQKF